MFFDGYSKPKYDTGRFIRASACVLVRTTRPAAACLILPAAKRVAFDPKAFAGAPGAPFLA